MKLIEVDDAGIELETEEQHIITPFDPSKIRVKTRTMPIKMLMERIKENAILLTPDFQRKDGLWSNTAQSRLIESILIRIPLPAFYMDATNEKEWLVIDGLQRLGTLKRFILEEKLLLTNLEFLTEQENKTFDNLERHLQRRIEETDVMLCLIEEGTPEAVKFNIFKRINTGSLPLSAQEIRHALNLGKGYNRETEFLTHLAKNDAFLKATDKGINNKRMADKDVVLRFLAFYLTPYQKYKTDNLNFDSFINDTMELLSKKSNDELDFLEQAFINAMNRAYAIFGENSFRKKYQKDTKRRYPINKALFETVAVNLAILPEKDINVLIERKNEVIKKFILLMESKEFDNAISQWTHDGANVEYRFLKISNLFNEVINYA